MKIAILFFLLFKKDIWNIDKRKKFTKEKKVKIGKFVKHRKTRKKQKRNFLFYLKISLSYGNFKRISSLCNYEMSVLNKESNNIGVFWYE